MEEKKSFWRKYELLIIILGTVIFIYLVTIFNQKINFLLGNELLVNLAPNQKSLSVHYGDISEVEFDVSMDNVAYCKAACRYSFTDRSANSIIDESSFELNKKQHLVIKYNLTVKRLGSGQDIYGFDVKCRSIPSLLCLAGSKEKSRSSLVIVNYDLTETEKELKKMLKQNVTELLEVLNNVDVAHQKISQKYFELARKVNLNNLTKDKIGIDDGYDKTRVSIENLRSIWAVEDYIKLNHMFNESFFIELDKIEKSITELDKSIDSIVIQHNEILSKLGALNKNLGELSKIMGLIESNEMPNEFSFTILKFNNIALKTTTNDFGYYNELLQEVAALTEQQNSLIEKTKNSATGLFFKSAHLLNFENDLLCSLKGGCKGNISVTNMIQNAQQFIKDYPYLEMLMRNCDSIGRLEETYSHVRNESLTIINEKNLSFPPNDNFVSFANIFKDNEIRSINNSYQESFEQIKSENKTGKDMIEIANSILPPNKIGLETLNYNQSINISLYLLSRINISGETASFLKKCSKLKPLEEIYNFSLEPISTNISYKIAPNIEVVLSDNPPICCIFNDCKPCCRDDSCRNDPKTFPLIFLHGHSIARGNSPDFSLDAFNKLQIKLQEDGYLNAGIVSLYSKNEQTQKGVWGLSGRPVTVKVSYYYDAFRQDDKYIVVPTKSENIDTYALRLRELIDIVKERTNKPRVNIIAHSMGGLVARRYVQIFGESDIDKLIMIGTPNKGIAGQVSDYCGIIGENRECQDMQENSLFINKLNDPFEQPKNIKLYSIIGQGCRMKLGDGDGIVLSENAKLGNAKLDYINGSCEGIGDLIHTEMLDIEKYPETYKIITDILQE